MTCFPLFQFIPLGLYDRNQRSSFSIISFVINSQYLMAYYPTFAMMVHPCPDCLYQDNQRICPRITDRLTVWVCPVQQRRTVAELLRRSGEVERGREDCFFRSVFVGDFSLFDLFPTLRLNGTCLVGVVKLFVTVVETL